MPEELLEQTEVAEGPGCLFPSNTKQKPSFPSALTSDRCTSKTEYSVVLCLQPSIS